MASYKGAYVTNIDEFKLASYQQYHHKRYVQQLQYFLKLHQRNRRCLPDPAQSINSKKAKKPLSTSPCFQEPINKKDSTRIQIAHRPVSPGSILSSPYSRSKSSGSKAVRAVSALSTFNSITCFSNSNRTPTPQPTTGRSKIPTVIVTCDGNQQLAPFDNRDIKVIKNMAPSSVHHHHSVDRNTTHHATHVTPSTNTTMTSTAGNQTSHLRKMVTFKLPDVSNSNNDTLHQRTRSISESSLFNCSTISDDQNAMPIQLRNQRNLPERPLNKHPMSPTLPIAKLRLFKELNLKDKDNLQNSLSRNSTIYNLNNINTMNNYNSSLNGGVWPTQRNSMFDPRFAQNNQFSQTTGGLSRYSHSLPNSPSKRSVYNQDYNQRHLNPMSSYQPVDCYTIGATGVLSSHGHRFPLGTIPPINSISPHNISSLSPQTSSLPTYSQITKPSFLDVGSSYSYRSGLYNPVMYDKVLQRLKQRIPVCKSAPLSSIMANSMPATNQFSTHDAVTGLPRRNPMTKSSLSPKINLGTGQMNKTLLTDGTIEQDSPLRLMRKEIKYYVDERKRQLEQDALNANNLGGLTIGGHLNTISNNLTSKYQGSNSNLSNSTAIFNDQSPLSSTLFHTSPNLNHHSATALAQNHNYISSSESDLNALLNLYSYPPDPVLDRLPPAGTSVFQRLPQYYLNRTKKRYTVDDLRRQRNPLDYYYDDTNLFNQTYGNPLYDPILDQTYYRDQMLPTSTYHSLIDWPLSYASYTGNNRPSYYASTGSLRTLQTPAAGLNGGIYNRLNLIGGANRIHQDQNLMSDNYLQNHYSLDKLGLDYQTSYSRPNSPYYNHSAVPPPVPLDYSLSTNHLDLIDLNNNLLLNKSLGQTTSALPLRSYRL